MFGVGELLLLGSIVRLVAKIEEEEKVGESVMELCVMCAMCCADDRNKSPKNGAQPPAKNQPVGPEVFPGGHRQSPINIRGNRARFK